MKTTPAADEPMMRGSFSCRLDLYSSTGRKKQQITFRSGIWLDGPLWIHPYPPSWSGSTFFHWSVQIQRQSEPEPGRRRWSRALSLVWQRYWFDSLLEMSSTQPGSAETTVTVRLDVWVRHSGKDQLASSYLLIVLQLIVQDDTVGLVRLRPGQSDAAGSSAHLMDDGHCWWSWRREVKNKGTGGSSWNHLVLLTFISLYPGLTNFPFTKLELLCIRHW